MKQNSRRNFIFKAGLAGVAFTGSKTLQAESFIDINKKPAFITISTSNTDSSIFKPLQKVNVKADKKGVFVIADSLGRIYATSSFTDAFEFEIMGALGNHAVVLKSENGTIIGQTTFKVDTATGIEDESGKYKELQNMLLWSMIGRAPMMDGGGGLAMPVLEGGNFTYFFVPWLRDHVHTLKGMKYYFEDIKPAISLFAKYQRKDGMIADNIYHSSKDLSMWDLRFSKGDFIWRTPDNKFEFKRIPVEADMEYLFIEGLYYTWKASGDTNWMISLLENAKKAVNYCLTDPYRWSQKYELIKRGYTIDTWDFQSKYHIEDTGGDIMFIDKDKTKFNIMFGDNTGMIASLRYLAEMFTAANLPIEAAEMTNKANDFQTKLDKLAWNGKFYTHQIPEDTSFKPDFGVDVSKQVSLSNSYSINRGIGHEKSVEIIKTYLEILKTKPSFAMAEWFGVYPPFEKGFDEPWEYVNGGVLSLVAGELSHGAFEHGFENYGVDILNRVYKIAKDHNGYLYGSFKGKMPEKPINQIVKTIDISKIANTDTSGNTVAGVIGWTQEGENDLHEMPFGKQTYFDINFDIIKPEMNGRKACIGISNAKGYLPQAIIPINQNFNSLYFLHIKAGDGQTGQLVFKYEDGTQKIETINDTQISGWWMPTDKLNFKVAWKGKNYKAPFVGVGVCGINNPNPEKKVKQIELKSQQGSEAKWFVLGVSVSDEPVYLKPNDISHGIPDKWGAAAVMYALVEGLAGVKDTGLAMDKITLAPRWAATTERSVKANIKYKASDGYSAYEYTKSANKIALKFTGNATTTQLCVLMPEGKKPLKVALNGKSIAKFESKTVESSIYMAMDVLFPGGLVEIEY